MINDDVEKAPGEFEREPLIKKKEKSYFQSSLEGLERHPFSFNGLKKVLKCPVKVYENFAVSNSASIESIESTLRSISYILPGRFQEAELVSEFLLSILNLFRYYNDMLLSSLDRSMSLHHKNLTAYFEYLKSRHPLLKTLMTILNVIKIVQIPMEMVVKKLMKKQRLVFVLMVEVTKFTLKFGLWQGSGWRPVPNKLFVSLERGRMCSEENFGVNATETENDPSSSVKKLESKMKGLDLQLKRPGSDPTDGLREYLKGHKQGLYTQNPQLSFTPTLDWLSWSRELAHLSRPSLYAFSLLLLNSKSTQQHSMLAKWSPILLSLCLDLFSKWSDIGGSSKSLPSLEAEERSRRLLDFLYYPIRGPIYKTITSDLLDSVEQKMEGLSVLNPLIETVNIYRKLCENVYFYTSAS